jgi:hypothetical protein
LDSPSEAIERHDECRLQVRFPLRKKLHEQCMARPANCLHYKPRGEIGRMNQTGIYEVLTAALPCLQLFSVPAECQLHHPALLSGTTSA